MRHAIFVLHPHGQSNFSATRLQAGLSSSSALCAKTAAAANTNKMRLFLNRRMFLRYSNYLRTSVGQSDLTGNQANDRPHGQYPEPDPDPRHQRENVGLHDGTLVVRGWSGKVDVQVLVQPASNRHFGSRLLARLVKPVLGL